MGISTIETADLDVFYGSADFGVEATVAGNPEMGLFNNEELETDKVHGVYPAFRCATRFAEGTSIDIGGVTYTVEDVLDLEFGEFIHALSEDGL